MQKILTIWSPKQTQHNDNRVVIPTGMGRNYKALDLN